MSPRAGSPMTYREQLEARVQQARSAIQQRAETFAKERGFETPAQMAEYAKDDEEMQVALMAEYKAELGELEAVKQEVSERREVAKAAAQDVARALGPHLRTFTPEERQRVQAAVSEAAFGDMDPRQAGRLAVLRMAKELDTEGFVEAGMKGAISESEMFGTRQREREVPEPALADKSVEELEAELNALVEQERRSRGF